MSKENPSKCLVLKTSIPYRWNWSCRPLRKHTWGFHIIKVMFRSILASTYRWWTRAPLWGFSWLRYFQRWNNLPQWPTKWRNFACIIMHQFHNIIRHCGTRRAMLWLLQVRWRHGMQTSFLLLGFAWNSFCSSIPPWVFSGIRLSAFCFIYHALYFFSHSHNPFKPL